MGRSYLSMVQDAERDCRDPRRFDALVAEQTPGGLNEQVRARRSSSFARVPMRAAAERYVIGLSPALLLLPLSTLFFLVWIHRSH